MEKAILEKLEWYLTVPTPYVFLVRYIKASVAPDLEVFYFAFDFHNIYFFFSLSSRDLTGLFLFVADVDGEYGVFSSWTGSYALSNNHFVLPFNDCCCSRFCRTLHSQQDPFLEWNSEALLRLLWRADNVSSLFFVILTCRPLVYVLLVFAAYGIMYACMGINHCWIICSLYKLCFRVPFWAKK